MKNIYYWLRKFSFARKHIGGIWVKTLHRGWITSITYQYYNAYGFDPVALTIEKNEIK